MKDSSRKVIVAANVVLAGLLSLIFGAILAPMEFGQAFYWVVFLSLYGVTMCKTLKYFRADNISKMLGWLLLNLTSAFLTVLIEIVLYDHVLKRA
jgi:hypothetical protein